MKRAIELTGVNGKVAIAVESVVAVIEVRQNPDPTKDDGVRSAVFIDGQANNFAATENYEYVMNYLTSARNES